MELGDLPVLPNAVRSNKERRNPRYNGIGWFTLNMNLEVKQKKSRNPRYNGIGWFTNSKLQSSPVSPVVAILAIMELGDLR